MGKKRKKKMGFFSKLVFVIALAVFCYSGYQLIGILQDYKAGEKEYSAIQETAVKETVVKTDSKKDAEIYGIEVAEPAERVSLQIDFTELQKTNSDVVGWIYFPNPSEINYPIVQGEDNSRYLTSTFEGHYNGSGAIFMDAYNLADFSDKNTFIYGHNMKNRSMFGQLRKYKEEDFYKQNPYFYIYTPDGKETTYAIFAVCVVEDMSESYNKSYADEQEFTEYLAYIRGKSIYETKVMVPTDGKIVTLSTCTNVTDSQRLVVHAVELREMMVTGE